MRRSHSWCSGSGYLVASQIGPAGMNFSLPPISFGAAPAAAAAAAPAANAAAAPAAAAAAPAAAAAAATPAAAAPAAAPVTAVVPAGPAVSVESRFESYASLLECVQDAWSGAVEVDTIRTVIIANMDSMAQVAEAKPSAKSRAVIVGKNIELDGSKVNLSDERTVQFVLELSSMLQVNELDALRLVFLAAASLSASDPAFGRGSAADVQWALRVRATELYFQRRFNLLLSTLDLVLMEREGGAGVADSGSAHVQRVVGESVAELVRLGITSNVMSCIESLSQEPTAPAAAAGAAAASATGTTPAAGAAAATAPLPDIRAYRALELSYLLRLLFALFKPSGSSTAAGDNLVASSDVGSEDLVRLVEHIQRRSAALTAAQTAATAKQAQISAQQEILAKQQQHALLYGGQFGAAGLNAPDAAAGSAAASTAVDGPDHVQLFNCYVLLCTMMQGLEVKYRALATSISAGARAPVSGGGSKAEKAAAAAAANAVANLFQVIIDLSRRLDSPSNWSNDVFRCGALLVWSLFLKRVKLLQPGAVSETDEEIQQMVLEGLGGSENQGFWIDLEQTIATNPAFAGIKKAACVVAGTEQEELLNATAAANNAAGSAQSAATAAAVALSSSSPSSSSLLSDLSEVLGEFLAGVISLHGKEMDLLRREDKKVQAAHVKAVARYEKLVQQQAQQQQLQTMQMAHSYGGQFSGFNGANAAAASAPIVVGEPPQPPQLNFQSFLSVLSSLLRSTPALESLLWSTPGFDAFLGAELDARSSSSANQPVNLGLGMPGHGASTPGGSLLSGSNGVNPGSFHTNSSSSNSVFTSDSPFLLSYIDLLSSLCHDASSSLRVYSFVRGCSRINWEMVCVHYMQQGLIAHYLPAAAQDDQANQQAMRRGQTGYGFGQNANAYRPPVPSIAPLTTKQLALLSSLLQLLSSLLRPSPALQSAFGLHSDFKLLDTAFGLLGLKLPVSVKAHVLEVISSLSRGNQDMAMQVWERLERSQVLPTRNFAQTIASAQGAQGGYAGLRGAQVSAPSLLPSGAALEGLLFDLEEVENQMQIYPLTSSFLHLIVTLMESAPLPASLGMGIRGVGTSSSNQQMMQSSQNPPQQLQGVYGVAPYLSFIHAHVFLNLPHRAYARPMESFVLAELVLAAFARVAGDFVRECGATSAEGTASFSARHESHSFSGFDSQASQSPLQSLAMHPAYTLLRDILQGKEVLSQIILQLHSAYSLLENEGQLASPSGVGVVHPSVEGTLLQSTRLLWIILEQEELVVDVMQRIEEVVNGGNAASQGFGGLHGRLSPLSGLLLQHQPCVITLAKCVGFIQNHTGTSVQQLLREKMARDKAKQKAASANGIGSVSSAAAALNQQMPNLSSMAEQSPLNQSSILYEQEAVEDDPMMTAAANAAAAASSTALALEAADDGRTTEIAFYAASAMLLLSQRDESRLVHIIEAARLSPHVVAAFRRQIKYVQLPSSESAESADPDLTCNKARLVILDLLLSSLQTPSPATPHISLALLLLGFDLSTPGSVRATDLSRSPTSALLETLLFDLALKPGFARRFPSLAQSVYQMLFKLLSAPLTSAATLRWIKTNPSSGGAGTAGYLLTLLRRLPLVDRADLQEIEREWRAEAASALRDAADAETSSIALLRSSSLSHRVYSSLFQLSFVLRSLSLHYFILVGAQARARAGSGGLAGSAGGPQEQWLLDEELELYLSSLGFLGASPDDQANNAQESEDLPQSDWFAAGSAQSATSFLSASLGPNLRFSNGSGSSAGGRPMLLLDILSHMHEYLRLVLPASYVAQKLPVGVPEGAQAQRTDAAATGTSGATDGKTGSGSAALLGVTQGYFELATARYFDPQHSAFQYALSDVYSGAVQAGLSSSAAYALTRRCLEWNIVSSVLGCAKAAFESWKQSVEVVLLNSALVLMRADAAAFESTLLRMLHTLLSKLAAQPDEDESSSIWVALGEELSSLALTLIATLRDVLRYTSGAGAGSVQATSWSDNSHSAQWHAILSLLVSAILSTRHSSTRANLYAVFLQYILLALSRRQVIERAIAAAAAIDSNGSAAAADSDRWSLILAAQVRADAENLALLSSHNRPLLTLVVNDALDGSSKIRGLSYRFLNVLLLGAASVQGAPTNANASARDGPSRFFQRAAASATLPSSFTSSLLSLFGSNNLLLLFLNQLKSHDSAIETAIHATGARALQGYDLLLNTEALLGFLLQLSLDSTGASLLQDHQAVRVLSGLGFLHSRPTPSYSNGSAEFDGGASALPSPLDKFQTLHVLVLELLASLMQSMPRHAGLLVQVQGFFSASAQQEIVASLVKESYPTISEQSLEALCAGLAVLYHGAQAEKVNQPLEEEEQRKLQKGVGGARYTPQPRYGAAVQSQSLSPASPVPAAQPFSAFLSKHQPALLTLLSRYMRPFSDPRLRSYLTGLVRERQERIDLGESGGGVGEHLSAADASFSADTEATAALSTEVILEQGDIGVQRVFRKVVALISLQLSLPAAQPVVLFGPRLGDGSNLGFGLNGSARVFDRDSDSNGGASFDPAHPQLELLVSLIDDKFARWKESQATIGTLRKHLDVIAAAASQDSSDDAASLSGSRGGFGFGMDAASSPSSSLASLELEFFPPSASHAWYYQDASPAQRLGHLRVAVLRAMRSAQGMRDGHVWTMEHAIMVRHTQRTPDRRSDAHAIGILLSVFVRC